jgi:hypothetical protein
MLLVYLRAILRGFLAILQGREISSSIRWTSFIQGGFAQQHEDSANDDKDRSDGNGGDNDV